MIITEWWGVRPGHVEVTPRSGGLMMHNDWSSGRRTAAVTLTTTSALSPGWRKHDNRRNRGRTVAISHFTELLGQQHVLTNQGRSELELCPKRVPCSVMYYSSQGLFAQKVHHWIFSKSSAHSLHFIVWCSNVQYDFARCFRLNGPLLFALLYFLYCTAYFLSS